MAEKELEVHLTEADLARQLQISEQGLRNNRHLGKGIPYIKLGRAVRYRLSDVERYLAENRVGPTDA